MILRKMKTYKYAVLLLLQKILGSFVIRLQKETGLQNFKPIFPVILRIFSLNVTAKPLSESCACQVWPRFPKI